jgi:hypothetical protein
MRRFWIGFLVFGMMAGSTGVVEAKQEATQNARPQRVERTVEGRYGAYPAPVTGCNSPLGSFACVIIRTRATEAFFTAKVTDAHGQPVYVQVRGVGLETHFCGETKRPIPIRPGIELHFFVAVPNWGIQLDCPAHSVKTTGTISVTLANLPRAQPVRSGTILSGDAWFVESKVGACQMAPDCRAWLETDCNAALAERDPAVMASIVRVDDLADGRTPRGFDFKLAKPAGLRWGGIVLQFWREDCTQIRGSLWRSWQEGRYGNSQRGPSPVVPVSAEWMTVSSAPDNPHIEWTLT